MPENVKFAVKAKADVKRGASDVEALAQALEAAANYIRSFGAEPKDGELVMLLSDKLFEHQRAMRALLDIITDDNGLAERASGLSEAEMPVVERAWKLLQ